MINDDNRYDSHSLLLRLGGLLMGTLIILNSGKPLWISLNGLLVAKPAAGLTDSSNGGLGMSFTSLTDTS